MKQLFPEDFKEIFKVLLPEGMEGKITTEMDPLSRIKSKYIRWILASVIFGITVFSIKADNCASTRTRLANALSP